MVGPYHSIFDSPSFIQRILKKKSSNKYNIRPLYTADIVAEVGPWKKQFQAATRAYSQRKTTKTYNMFSQPELSPSNSSTTTSSMSDSTILMPVPSISTPISNHHQQPNKTPRKRPLSSEILIKIMDQRLMKEKQLQQHQANHELIQQHKAPLMSKSLSCSTVNSLHQPGLTAKIQSTVRRSSRRHQLHQPRQQVLPSPLTPKKSSIRKKPTESEANYVLTQNNDEQDRMVAQHYLLRTAFGSDFSAPIASKLQKGIVVLDVGCGPGTWTMEMSTAFPKSTFIGIDQSAFYPKDIKPRNCHFRTCGPLVSEENNELVLPFPDNSIDYIYQRDMNWALTGQTWQPLLLEYQRILKPGGWIECVEPELEKQNCPKNECLMNDKLINGLLIRQQDPYAVHRLPTTMSLSNFTRIEGTSRSLALGWGSSHMNTPNSSVMEDGETVVHQEEEDCSEFARAMSSQYLFLLKSLKPWLSNLMGLNSEKYDDYIAGLPAEWKRAQTCVNWHCIIAQKPYV